MELAFSVGQQQLHCCGGIIPNQGFSYSTSFRKETANSVDVRIVVLWSCQAGTPDTWVVGRHPGKAFQYLIFSVCKSVFCSPASEMLSFKCKKHHQMFLLNGNLLHRKVR